MKKSELPAKIEGIREMVAKKLYGIWEAEGIDRASWQQAGEYTKKMWRLEAHSFLSKLTEHGARIKINGKWYGLDGTPVKEG